jgi:hypothetical protein
MVGEEVKLEQVILLSQSASHIYVGILVTSFLGGNVLPDFKILLICWSSGNILFWWNCSTGLNDSFENLTTFTQ